MNSDVAFECNETFSVISIHSDPNKMYSPTRDIFVDDDDITVVTSNVSEGSTTSLALAGTEVTRMPPHKLPKWGYAAMTISSNEAIADSGATQIFFVDCITHQQPATNNVSAKGCFSRWAQGNVNTYVQHYNPRPPPNARGPYHPGVVHCLPVRDPCPNSSGMHGYI